MSIFRFEFFLSAIRFSFGFLFLVVNQSGVSQNLIPDPGFEAWNGTIGSNPNTLGAMTYWYNANGTPDHHHQLNPPGSNLTSLLPCPKGTGDYACGEPYEGQGVLGCWKGNGTDGTREWAGTKLNNTVKKNNCYKISFQVQNKSDNPNFFSATNQWGIYFSKTKLPSPNPDFLNYNTKSKQWVACKPQVNSSEWTKFEFTYTSDDDYDYIFIGYMGNVAGSDYLTWSNDPLIGFYVWFDDVRIEPILPQLTVVGSKTICYGDSVFISANSNYPVVWTDNQTNQIPDSSWVKPLKSTKYYVQTQDGTLCSLTDSVEIIVIEPIVKKFNKLVCAGNTPFIVENTQSGNWNGNGIIDPASGMFDPSLAGPGTHTLEFKSFDDCSKNIILEIEVTDTPEISFIADDILSCLPAQISFVNTSFNKGLSVNWDFGDGMASDQLNVVHGYIKSGSYDVQLTVMYSDYCNVSLLKPSLIKVLESPTAGFDYLPKNPDVLSPLIQFTDYSSSDVILWNWDFGYGFKSSEKNPKHTFDLSGTYLISLEVVNNDGCRDTLNRIISVNPNIKFYIPNVFSPNGDGINDKFQVYYSELPAVFKISIFNRWGSLVYESNSIDEIWDGTVNGKKSDNGVYVYKIEYEISDPISGFSKTKLLSGDINIVK